MLLNEHYQGVQYYDGGQIFKIIVNEGHAVSKVAYCDDFTGTDKLLGPIVSGDIFESLGHTFKQVGIQVIDDINLVVLFARTGHLGSVAQEGVEPEILGELIFPE